MSGNATLPEVTVTASRIVDAPAPTPAPQSPPSLSPPAQVIGSPFAAPACSVEIYPFEGGPFTISGGQIRSVTTSKSLHGNAQGTFSIDLAPGGPEGVEDPLTWSQIITPMSHALIGMTRGADAALVMDGVVVSSAEVQQWETTNQSSSAGRGQNLSGGDFSWFFNTFNYYALTFYGLTAGTPIAAQLNFLPPNIYTLISQGLLGSSDPTKSNPVEVGRTWFQKVMSGENGIMGHTYVPYKDNSRVPFYQAVGAVWENYPKVFIPYSDYFMTAEETWMGKFQNVFPFPWYEFFVTTAPSGAYALAAGAAGYTDQGSLFGMQSIQVPSAGPVLVARVNPVPKFGLNGLTPGDMDTSHWDALPLYDLTQQPYNFMRSNIEFPATDSRNFYQLNPMNYSSLFGTNNANNIPFLFQFIAAADPASIQRYGFRPQLGSTRWMWDPQGTAGQNPDLNVQDTILQLTAAMVSWFHPQPLMAQAEVILPLSPSIMIGTRFRYAPFKDLNSWDFYVERVVHQFQFGGTSSTRVTLSRGLPTTVYQDTNGLLKAVYTGNAMRKDGIYTSGLPSGSSSGLTFLETQQQAAELNAQLAKVFVTPQSPSASGS